MVAGLAVGYATGWQHYLSLHYLAASREALKVLVADNPVLAPVVFALLYVLAVALAFPASSVLTIFAGFLFGWPIGVRGRGVLRDNGRDAAVSWRRAARSPTCWSAGSAGRATQLKQGFETDAFGYLLVLRLTPMLPFFIVNIAPAFFNVRLKTFLAATVIGILPGTFAYTWLGVGVDSVIVAAQRAGHDVSMPDLVTPQITLALASARACGGDRRCRKDAPWPPGRVKSPCGRPATKGKAWRNR